MHAANIKLQNKSTFQWQTLSLLLVFLGFSFFGQSCKKGDGTDSKDFDQSAMLKNYAENIIIPAYQLFNAKADSLKNVQNTFAQNPSLANLELVQTTFLNTYRAWQIAEMYEFGPAADVLLRSSLNTFPCDTSNINKNISAGSYNFDLASNTSSKGLPALDYLLFGLAEDNSAILSFYTSASGASKRLQYLEDLTEDISTKSSQVLSKWEAGYKDVFITGIGTSIGSSTSLFVNQFNYEYELIKNPKIGIPLGKKSLGSAKADKTEAFYSGISRELALQNIENILNVFQGIGLNSNASGESLKTYLDVIDANYSEQQTLSAAIIAQFQKAIAALKLVPDPLSEAVTNNYSIVDEAYNEIQKAIVLIKTDMTSAMGIQITYQDSDGD